MNRFLSMDEEGFFLSDGVRWTEPALGHSLLQSLKRSATGAFEVQLQGQPYILEAFDEPLVAQAVRAHGSSVELLFPYEFNATMKPGTLSVDAFDRFHGLTAHGMPFVLSRTAQAQLFDACDEFDDDSLVLGGERVDVGPWLVEDTAVRAAGYWEGRYQRSETGWDLACGHEGFDKILPQLKAPRSRIAVLGCGQGHDAALLASHGHLVTAFDYSESALRVAQEKYGSITGLKFVRANAFELPESYFGQFDVVFEHTFFCAMTPALRPRVVDLWKRLLSPRGQLWGVFFAIEKRSGPPWGSTEWELRERLRRHFSFLYWTRIRTGPATRLGAEVFILAQKTTF